MKRLAVFLDGTWNTLENNTNVWRLRSLCDPAADDQRVYYSKGVGTTFGQSLRGGVEGYGIDREIVEAYTWLVENFSPRDQIFVFGFSRGAYTARSLSGLIAKCGVLGPGAPLSIEQLYGRYRRRNERTIAAITAGPEPDDLEEHRRPPRSRYRPAAGAAALLCTAVDPQVLHAHQHPNGRRVGHRRLPWKPCPVATSQGRPIPFPRHPPPTPE